MASLHDSGIAHRDREPRGIPLTRPAGTLSPTGGEGRGEGVQFMEGCFKRPSSSVHFQRRVAEARRGFTTEALRRIPIFERASIRGRSLAVVACKPTDAPRHADCRVADSVPGIGECEIRYRLLSDHAAFARAALCAWIFRTASMIWSMSRRSVRSMFCVIATVVAQTCRLPFSSWKLSR